MKNDSIGRRISELVEKLNQYRHKYYNLAKPSVFPMRCTTGFSMS